MSLNEADVAAWTAAKGRSRLRRQYLDGESLRRFMAAAGRDPDPSQGTALAHWAWFLEVAPDSEIGADGHPKRGGFLPAVTLPRRMFAASDIRFMAPLSIGAEADLIETVAEVTCKSGRSGDLVFVEVDRELVQDGTLRVEERQTIVYRDAGPPQPLPPVEPAAADATWVPTETALFRFSAATFNSHRIHYDLRYATAEEGYPALVVHGPLTATRLADFAAATRGPLKRFQFRALSPLFCGQPIRLVQGEQRATFTALRCDGATAMTAEVE
jgi:3-methylfumaryl-CoA hydratase